MSSKNNERDFQERNTRDLNYDKISPGITPSFIHQLSCTVHPRHAWWDRDIDTR